mmetsp:Transcript_62731/g.181817  ORF Transcript_62731/g.181817 Transcript_62731/m.181817 type:complete len:205 (-) Transcript_62731:604-1218(-)
MTRSGSGSLADWLNRARRPWKDASAAAISIISFNCAEISSISLRTALTSSSIALRLLGELLLAPSEAVVRCENRETLLSLPSFLSGGIVSKSSSVASAADSRRTATTTLTRMIPHTIWKETKYTAVATATAGSGPCRSGRATASDHDSVVNTWNMVYMARGKLPKYSFPISRPRDDSRGTASPDSFNITPPAPNSLQNSTAKMA